ncbi:MAG: excinuclease ABC subunit UvrA [Deltaproteobacteria bacterium]|nr:excinuclease ABC subunit UvrA [Deltaproteobacteria bacterium]
MTEKKQIVIRGAREHNLKNINVNIPRNKLVVITGVSGSGKSSLAFDTLYAEGQRRYVESLSAYARQFLEQMDKPDVDLVEGLSPAISIEQRSVSKNPRSTVGTATEIYDHLRLLFARVGTPYCWKCGKKIEHWTIQEMTDMLMKLETGTKLDLLAPVVRDRKGNYKTKLESFRKQGFVKARIDGKIFPLEHEIELDKKKKHTIEIFVDRLKIKNNSFSRIADSLETCLKLSDGLVLAEPENREPILLSERFACPVCGVSFPELQPRTFSFNSPHGACPLCQGLGIRMSVDPEKVVADPNLTLRQGAIAPWAFPGSEYVKQMFETMGIDLDTRWKDLSKKARETILNGSGTKVFKFKLSGRMGQGHTFIRSFEGVIPSMERRHRETESERAREEIEKFMSLEPCPACTGKRLRPEALSVLIGGKNIAEIAALPVSGAIEFLSKLPLKQREKEIARRPVKEITERLGFLSNVGLDYLTLDRPTASLSGGEAQRIRLATQIGSALVGVLYVLDEPSVGLHPKDNSRLLDTLENLKNLGNTVVVVEHDEDTIRKADHVIDLGPGAGESGGKITAQGTPSEIEKNPRSLTGKYLSGRLKIDLPKVRRKPAGKFLKLEKACRNNLKHIDVTFPIGCFIAVTGVSGSGKSSLVLDTLYPALSPVLSKKLRGSAAHGSLKKSAYYESIKGAGYLDKVIHVDQSPIGRTPRSNPATYTGVFTPIRELFSSLPESRARGYGPGRFSFNVKGGRCEACRGDGTIRIEMHFLPDVYVRCEQCKGSRFNRETLDIKYKGFDIAEVLRMTVSQAKELFTNVPAIEKKLALLEDVGLGYIQLGQSATTLSGGEAQRIKLSRELSKRGTGRTLYILDEPTTGLHFHDVRNLLDVLHKLVDKGNTVIIIEHNLEVIKTADWIIDLGPEGGDRGGMIVKSGPPEEIAACDNSYTGRYLNMLL